MGGANWIELNHSCLPKEPKHHPNSHLCRTGSPSHIKCTVCIINECMKECFFIPFFSYVKHFRDEADNFVSTSGWLVGARACPECVQPPTAFSHWGEPVRYGYHRNHNILLNVFFCFLINNNFNFCYKVLATPGKLCGGVSMSANFPGARSHGTPQDTEVDVAWQELMAITELQVTLSTTHWEHCRDFNNKILWHVSYILNKRKWWHFATATVTLFNLF